MTAVQKASYGMTAVTEKKTEMPRLLYGLTVVTILGVVIGLYFALFHAETDRTGEIQRIFYIHVPAFSGAFIAFAVTLVGGILYLKTRSTKWDKLALAGVEVGFVLSVINLVTGSIWARPLWNTWWTWDPRLTSAAIMALTYAAYLMLRNGIEDPERRRRFASVYGILAMSTVIFTLVVIRIRPDTIHPAVIGPSPQNAEGGFSMTANMITALGFNSFVWSVLLVPVLIWWRVRLENIVERVQKVKMMYLES